MRKIVASMSVSLDGVMEAPWKWPVKDNTEEVDKMYWALVDAGDVLLMGRVTYEEFAEYWSHEQRVRAEQVRRIPGMKKMRKYVVSSTLRKAEWTNTTLIREHVAEEIAKLKRQPGKDITVPASGTLVEWLLHQGLLDELHLFVFPVILGSGRRLFKEGGGQAILRLTSSDTLSADVLHLIYQPR